MLANTSGSFLYSQPGHADLHGWDTAAEGTQNFNGEEDFHFSYGQVTPRGQDQGEAVDDITSKWIATEQPQAPVAEPMRRISSRGSSGSHKNRTLKASAHKSRPRLLSTVSQGSHMSSYDMTGNPQMDAYLLQDADAHSVSSQMFYPTLPMSVNLTADGLPYSPAVLTPGMGQQHIDPTQMQLNYDANFTGNSPAATTWSSLSPVESRISTPGVPEDAWSVPMDSSPTRTNDSSPIMDGISPRYVKLIAMIFGHTLT